MISFHDISKLFNAQQWDIGYLSAERLLQCSLSPVKAASHPYGHNFTNSIHFQGVTNIPFCRECTSQPRCSKWGGKYPYEQYRNPKVIPIVNKSN
jgi:hypothetical protein